MTVAEFISLDETARLLKGLRDVTPGGSFLCDQIVYALPDSSFRFEAVLAIPLGGSSLLESVRLQHRKSR